MNSLGVMAWCATLIKRIVGPCFLKNASVTGESYRNMLTRYAFLRLRLLQQDYIFEHNGAPPHYSNRARDYLNSKRPENWIGKGGAAVCPPRAPNLTPCDFFVRAF